MELRCPSARPASPRSTTTHRHGQPATRHRDQARGQDDRVRAYVLIVAAALIASALVGDTDGRGDVFLADQAWFYVTLFTIGFMISRGLAKAGRRARRDA
jgi:hypothetical protein